MKEHKKINVDMRVLFFKIFGGCRRLEDFLFEKLVGFFSLIGFRKIPAVCNLSSAIHKARGIFFDSLYEKLKPKGIVLLYNVQGNKMYVNTEDKSMVPYLLLNRVWEKYKTELFKKIVTQGMTVVDVGAGIGYYTLIAAKLVGKTGVVYAFEPEPCNYELLSKNIELNEFTNIVSIKKAISDKKGKANLYFEKQRIVNPSLSRENVLAASKHKVKVGFREVKTISLDEFFEKTVGSNKVDVIKVDSEGAEGLMVDGAEEILKSNNLKMFIEFWPEGLEKLGTEPLRILQKLKEYGFKAKVINETDQSAVPIEIIEFYIKMKPGQGFDLLLEK